MNAKPKSTLITIAATVVMCLVVVSIQAAPADEIQRAVAKSGAQSVSAASPDAFLHAFSSVVIRHRGDVAAYVSAAVAMRTDLAPQITVATLRACRPRNKETAEKQGSCDWVDPIIRTAIATAPSQADAIVRAAIDAEPYAQACILAAAGKNVNIAYARRTDGKEVVGKETVGKEAPCPQCPEELYLRPPGIDVGNVNSSIVGTINPANLGQGGIISPEQLDPK